jgi:transposase-like protein
MKRRHCTYTPEFKKNCVLEYQNSGLSLRCFSKQYEIPTQSLSDWVQKEKNANSIPFLAESNVLLVDQDTIFENSTTTLIESNSNILSNHQDEVTNHAVKKRRNYPSDYKEKCIFEFQNSDLSLYSFSKLINVPKQTFSDWVKRHNQSIQSEVEVPENPTFKI